VFTNLTSEKIQIYIGLFYRFALVHFNESGFTHSHSLTQEKIFFHHFSLFFSYSSNNNNNNNNIIFTMEECHLFDRESPERDSRQTAPFTPCSGLSRMSLNTPRVLPSTSFADKLSQVMEEESGHPNLIMFLNDTNKITMSDSKKNVKHQSNKRPCNLPFNHVYSIGLLFIQF
jgi:hypothetical protein